MSIMVPMAAMPLLASIRPTTRKPLPKTTRIALAERAEMRRITGNHQLAVEMATAVRTRINTTNGTSLI